MKTIPEQVRLSPAVAFNIVLQGIKVRLGRSIVTILGVALGIAFLTSILAGRIIETGVAKEKQLRVDVNRMMSFLIAETGSLKGHDVLFVTRANTTAELNESELRLIESVRDLGGKIFLDKGGKGAGLTGTVAGLPAPETQPPPIAAIGIGPGQDPATLEKFGADVVAYTRPEGAPATAGMGPEPHSVTTAPATTQELPAHHTIFVSLSRQPTDEELRDAAEAAGRANARDIWIGVIALCVTVIGITNSMLMSVTERFREIGTMRCLGAVSGFIRRLFLIESLLVGAFGAVGGAVGGALFATVVYGFRFGFGLVLGSLSYPALLVILGIAVVVGMVLSIVAALYPANVAAKMVPATALRTNV